VYEIINRPSGTRTFGPSGEILFYSVNLAGGFMTVWNSSWAYMEGRTGMSMAWNVLRTSINATTRGLQHNYTIPTGLTGSTRVVDFVDAKKVIGVRTAANYSEIDVWAYSLEPGREGMLLYKNSAKNPQVWADGATFSNGPLSVDDGVFTIWSPQLRQWWGYSLETGKQIWGPTTPEHYLNLYDKGHTTKYGLLYSTGCSGEVKCYNIKTGELLWTYHPADPYSEILWNNDWWMHIVFVTDGKLYLSHEEHSPIDPLPRGAPFVCLNATTGEVIWRADGLFRGTHWGGRAIIGESIILTQDTYDQRMYAIGKGPSALTVTAPDVGLPFGSSVMVRGMVTDVSPGTRDIALEMRFPQGVPAVADESMSDWMLYVYKQFPRPIAVGVEVAVDVIDSNGNYRNIGTTTSDSTGRYGFAWTPDIPGEYTVIATFAGSKSYYPSYDVTYFIVDPAAEPTPSPTPTPASIAETYFIPATSGLLLAIIIGFALIAILLIRKRS
jgi:hypothetical protein